MVLTVTEDTPADMLAGSMELLVQLPRDHHIHTQRVTVERSTAMMDLLVQIATAHKLAASSYTLQAIGEHGLVLPHQSNTPIGALDALEVKLLPKQGTFIPRKTKLASQPFETTFRLQVHLPRNQLYVSRVSPKTNLGDILDDVCREKNLDKNKYELRHPGNHKETLDLSLSLQDYHLQEVTLYAKQGQSLGSALSSQDIMALQRQEERRRQQAKQSVFGFIFKKSKESSLSTDSLGGRSVSPARSDETGRSVSPLAPPTRPQRKRRPAPNPPMAIHQTTVSPQTNNDAVKDDDSKEKLVISHSRNSSDSSGYHEASVLSDNPDSAGRMPETLPRRSRPPSKFESRKLAQTSQTSKSLCNLATSSGCGLTHAISNTSLSSAGIRKKRAAPKPPISRPLSSAISTQALERIVDSEESLTSDMGISKPPSDIAVSSETEINSKANSDIAMSVHASTKLIAKKFCHTVPLETTNNVGKRHSVAKLDSETCHIDVPKAEKNISSPIEDTKKVERARVAPQAPVPKPRNISKGPPVTPRRVLNLALSSSPSDVKSIISIKNISNTININDFNKTNHEKQEDKEDKEINEYPNSNNEKIVSENTNKFIEDNKKANDIVDNNNDILDLNNTLNQNENSSLLNADVSLKSNESSAIISTVPKYSQLTTEISKPLSIFNENNMKDNELTRNIDGNLLTNLSRSKDFRNLSTFSNIEVDSFEKNNKKVTSHDRNFTCALNPNFTPDISHMEVNEKMNLVMKIPRNALSENDTCCEEQYPPFIIQSTNLGLQMDLTHSTAEEKLYSQRMGKAGVDGSPTETDLLLQKVSTTLANVSPTSERLSQDVTENEVNHVEKMDRVHSKTVKAPAHEETGLDNTPNTTLNSQQDTSDYVSATGEDLSATDWEYQLPDPPSAFRDNVGPDHGKYETITPRSVDAVKEPAVTIINSTGKNFNRQVNVQNEAERLAQLDIKKTSPVITTTNLITEKCDEKNINIDERNRDINTPRLSLENHKKDLNIELKKVVISELENKIENGIFNPLNHKNSDEEFNQSSIDKLAPKIAPIENTLPNFTITTYSRQKSLNIYDASMPMSSSYRTNSAQDRIVKTFATLSRNASALPTKKESYTDLSNHNYRQANDFEINNGPITRATSVQHINLSNEEQKNPVKKTIEVPLRQQDTVNVHDKSNIIHRSKSYIVLSHNSKYRSNKTLVSNIIDDSRMMKSTSVTNLNQDTLAIDNEKSHHRENDLKKSQNEKNEDRELQSVQVLKCILPQLKVAQRADNNASEVSVTEHYNEENILNAKSDETDEVSMRNKTERNKSESEETIKRWRYTGPPAISLGSWSERPCLNVKIKMDTDYKFGVNNNNSNINNNINNNNNSNSSSSSSSSSNNNNNNTTGAKTIVNLNSSSNDVDIVNYKDSFTKNLPKNYVKNDNVTLSSNDTKESHVKRVMDDVGITKKKVANASPNQMESGLNNFDFVKLRMRARDESDKPVVVTNVAVKKSYAEKPELEDDDVKIDTRPVNFKALTQAFGQINLRAIPKYNSQNRHSDYFDGRQGGNDLVDNKFMKRQTNVIAGEINRPPIKRHTSVIGIDAQPFINNFRKNNEEIKKIHSTTTKVNGPSPTVKGFHINHPNKTPRIPSFTETHKNSFTLNNKINGHVPPPPPTMPVITGVTLKSNNAAPKSVSTCKDPRDQLLESIRNYGRDKLKSVDTLS